MEYLNLSDYLKSKYGCKVYKLSLQSGCSCPNRDGRIGSGGCTFCSEGGSGDFAAPFLPVDEQIAIAKKKVDAKFSKTAPTKEHKYIAYFQSYTNTYGEPERLRGVFEAALRHPEIVALSIGTRPDCLQDAILLMLEELRETYQKEIWIELGLQTIHEKTAEHIHRGYPLSVFEDAYRRLKEHGFLVVVHVILGLPGESGEDMLETVRYLSSLTPVLDGIKLQLLHILKGTQLAEEYEAAPFPLFTLEEYCSQVTECLALLPKETVVHRITGDGPKSLLIAPLWSADKKRVLNTLNKAIRYK